MYPVLFKIGDFEIASFGVLVAIGEELWNSKSAALQDELRQVRTEMERHEVASQAYETAGLQILELAQTAYSSYVAKNPHEQARLIKTLVSNSTFDRGSLSPTYAVRRVRERE